MPILVVPAIIGALLFCARSAMSFERKAIIPLILNATASVACYGGAMLAAIS